jgi:peroxiredoxin
MNNVYNLAQRILVLLLFTGIWTTAGAQDFDWAPDFPVGASIPALEAPDQNGEVQTLGSLAGDKGILLVFSRSFDWCPFCKAQLDGLQTASSDFEAAGFSIVTLTYDPIDTLKLVEEDMDIGFTMLHDEVVKHVNAFNILNTGYEPGHFAYGVPQPGVMLVSSDGEILAKFAEENFRVRPDWSDVVAAANNL